jgi:hypothetical protein
LFNFDLDQFSGMKALLQHTIEILKKRVKENLDTINQNQSEIRQLLTQPLSAERTYYIENHYDINKVLLSENNDFINLQVTLLNFMEKYKDFPILDEEELPEMTAELFMDDHELFELTIQGKLVFNIAHPKFEDEEFFQKLLTYYSTLEAYEKCNSLLKTKEKTSPPASTPREEEKQKHK